MSATPTISWPVWCRLAVSNRSSSSRARKLSRPSPSEAPDLILLDLMLPDIDGFEICDQLKRDRETNLIPIVMVTALHDAHHRAAGVRVGANGYLTKPFTPAQLYETIDTALAWHERAQQARHDRRDQLRRP